MCDDIEVVSRYALSKGSMELTVVHSPASRGSELSCQKDTVYERAMRAVGSIALVSLPLAGQAGLLTISFRR